MLASQNGRTEVVKLLIAKGIDVSCKASNGLTALILATKYGNKETLELLLEKGANVNDKSKNGSTALMLTSKKGYTEVLNLLLEKGVSIYEKDNFGKTVLVHVSNSLRNSKEKLKKDNFIEIAYAIIRKISEDYIHLFVSLNKIINTPKELKDEVHDYISLLYSLQNLPIEIFEEIIRNF